MGQPAYAATVTVDTTDDTVAPDGATSLREAIDLANAAGSDTTIELQAGATYELDLCGGATEDANASGDLDYTAGDALTINGNGAVIEQTCSGERVFHNTDGTATVTLVNLTLTGGEGQGAAVSYAGDLVLNGVTVMDNDAGASAVLDSEPGITGASLTLTGSTVGPNVGNGIRISFGSVTITGSTITQNTERGVGLVDGALSIADSVFENNGSDGARTTGQGSGLLTFTNSIARHNGGVGLVCSNCGDVQISDSKIHDNDGGGIAVATDQDEATDDLTISVARTSVNDNSSAGSGAGLVVTTTELTDDAPLAQVLIDSSTFARNSAGGSGGAIHVQNGELRIDNSTVVENSAATSGGGVATENHDIHVRHATITDNNAPSGANIASGADLYAFASIVAAAAGGGGDCAIAGATTSTGFNIGGDATCAFAGTADVNSAGDPGLGPLQDNGGATLTRQPLAASVAVGKVPATACTVLTVDQRGVTRPQGTACEAGSVEIGEGGNGLPPTGVSVTWIMVAGAILLIVGAGVLLLIRRRAS